jgi:hypothetical protein
MRNLSGSAFRLPVILTVYRYILTITVIYGKKLSTYFRTREEAYSMSLRGEGEGHWICHTLLVFNGA